MTWMIRLFWGGGLVAGAYLMARFMVPEGSRWTMKRSPAPTRGAAGAALENDVGLTRERRAKERGATLKQKTFAEYVEQVRELKRRQNHAAAIELLLGLLAAAEQEARQANKTVAAWYYEQLAVIYRKEQRLADEIAILERYQQQCALVKSKGSPPLAARLSRARELRDSPPE